MAKKQPSCPPADLYRQILGEDGWRRLRRDLDRIARLRRSAELAAEDVRW